MFVLIWISLESGVVLTLFCAVLFAIALAFGFVKWMKFVDKHIKRLIMAHLIDKDVLVAQASIEITNCRLAAQQGILTEFGKGKLEGLEGIVDFLNTLEVKEVDLEKEIDKELDRNWYGEYINLDKFRESANYFFELGLKAQKGRRIMKELTIQEKAEAYDKAIVRAKRMFSEEELNYLFHEIAESDDEKIRKEILKYIDKATGCKRWIAWLKSLKNRVQPLSKQEWSEEDGYSLRHDDQETTH